MISKATVHNTTVLMNRRMNVERDPAAAGFGLVCSKVAGMLLHHHEGRRAVQDEAGGFPADWMGFGHGCSLRCYLVILLKACYGFVRDEQICGVSNPRALT
jgi:hypothetical protein